MKRDPSALRRMSVHDPRLAVEDAAFLSPIEEIVEDARNGRMFVLVDEQDRENEGDLVIPAQMATPDVINFMATHGRGLICLALTQERVQQLGLPLMPQSNASRLQTNFTVSIEASHGVSTGISAPDRARTIAAAIDQSTTPEDLSTPGHVFPVGARDGGVLVRAGHTEAGVDIARLAGLYPAAVICEIMKEDGTMARLPDLVQYAQLHGLKVGTIADLIAFRRRHDRIVELLAETKMVSRFGGEFDVRVYYNKVEYAEHVALVKGDLTADGPVLVRMHALDLFSDVLGDTARAPSSVLEAALKAINAAGRGVVVLIREPRPTALSDRLREEGKASPAGELRDYGVGAQILIDLGVREMRLLTNAPRAIIGLDGFGLTVVGTQPLTGSAAVGG